VLQATLGTQEIRVIPVRLGQPETRGPLAPLRGLLAQRVEQGPQEPLAILAILARRQQ